LYGYTFSFISIILLILGFFNLISDVYNTCIFLSLISRNCFFLFWPFLVVTRLEWSNLQTFLIQVTSRGGSKGGQAGARAPLKHFNFFSLSRDWGGILAYVERKKYKEIALWNKEQSQAFNLLLAYWHTWTEKI